MGMGSASGALLKQSPFVWAEFAQAD